MVPAGASRASAVDRVVVFASCRSCARQRSSRSSTIDALLSGVGPNVVQLEQSPSRAAPLSAQERASAAVMFPPPRLTPDGMWREPHGARIEWRVGARRPPLGAAPDWQVAVSRLHRLSQPDLQSGWSGATDLALDGARARGTSHRQLDLAAVGRERRQDDRSWRSGRRRCNGRCGKPHLTVALANRSIALAAFGVGSFRTLCATGGSGRNRATSCSTSRVADGGPRQERADGRPASAMGQAAPAQPARLHPQLPDRA